MLGVVEEAWPSTNAVVASCVVFVFWAAVGAAGVPVKVGDASGARVVSVGWTWSARAKLVEVPTVAAPFIAGATADA
jgi:hypothetical protein